MKLASDQSDERYKFALSLIMPLASNTFDPEDPHDRDPFGWKEWHAYRNGTQMRDLTSNPKRQPWIRLPHSSHKGSQPNEIFLRHIEELLYPGMSELRDKLDSPEESASWEAAFDVAFSQKDLPSERWVGLPKEGVHESLVIDFRQLEEPRSGFQGKLTLSVDAGEVISLSLKPQADPVLLGILHLSLGTEGFRTDAVEGLAHGGKSSGSFGDEWGQLLLKDVVFHISNHVSSLDSKAGEAVTPVLSRESSSGAREDSSAGIVGRGDSRFFLSRAWILATYFGVGAGSIRCKEGLENGNERTLPGGYFVLVAPPSALFDHEKESSVRQQQAPLSEEEIRKAVIRQAALARSEEDADVAAATGRFLMASTWRGTAILDRGSENAADGLTSINNDAFWSLNASTLRNLRSYWLQGTIVGILQHQLIKRFANELGLAGSDISTDKMGDLYGRWLTFGNLVWWSELTYARPPTDRLLRTYRKAVNLQGTYSDLSTDFDTYSSFSERNFEKAERKHDRDTRDTLSRLQVLGTAVVIIGVGAAISDILGKGLGNLGLGFTLLLAVIFTYGVEKSLGGPWSKRINKRPEDGSGSS